MSKFISLASLLILLVQLQSILTASVDFEESKSDVLLNDFEKNRIAVESRLNKLEHDMKELEKSVKSEINYLMGK